MQPGIDVIIMPKLFSDTHHIQALQIRLERVLTSPSDDSLSALTAQHSSVADQTSATGASGLKWITGRLSLLRSWRTNGYSPHWLIQRLPGIRDLFNLTWALLTIQGRLYRLQLAIQETQVGLKQLEQGMRERQRLAEQGSMVLDRRCAALQFDQDFMRREIELLESRFAAIQAPVAPPPPPTIGAQRDDWYMEFEETHRGSPQDIRTRQCVYLPFVREAIPDPSAGHVLDLGCGRGDWLALLDGEGFQARGVDSNATLVGVARRAGLRVHHADLFEYLASLGDRTPAAITAFQLVEHLPLDSLLVLFSEARRVLRPGGLLILETPNPENLQVGAYSFWMDPTHVRPLPPPLLHQLARHFGFIDIRIERLNPWPQYREDAESADPLNRLLYGGQDYALIARAPLSPEPAQTEHASLR